MKGLHGQVAIVTGGGAGIGQATCERFVEEGTSVVIADLDADAGKRAEALLQGRGGKARFVNTNVADESSVVTMVEQTVAEFGRVDILVNCAAKFIMRGVDASVRDWSDVLAVNVIGCALCAKHSVPHMRRVNGGAIVNICSISAVIAQSGFLTYSASKGALLTMTKCMALDLAPDRIRVNAVSPGTVWTASNADFILRNRQLGRKEADRHPEIGGLHLLSRTADPEEVASVIAFLASADASFVTGENVMVDGGYVIR